jgi:hypothetical protein
MMPQPDEVPEGAVSLAKPFSVGDLLKAVGSVLGPGRPAPAEPALAVLPVGIKSHQPDTGIGLAGGPAQPLAEPEE